MAGKIQLQQAFQKTYELPLFIKNILYPVFANRVKIYQNPVIETNKANTTELRVIKSVKCYGQIDLDDESSVKCYEIILNPGVRLEYNKVSIQQYVRKLLTAGQAILVNFQQPEDKNLWRLSLVASDSKIIEDKIEQVKTNAKRYTYLLGPSETCRTASERFAELEALKDIGIENLVKAFSVEKLSKSFFDEYKLHYQSFNNYLINSNFRSSAFSVEKQKDENAAEYKPIRDFVKKMLGRIVFLYFVQKKGWLAASTIKYEDGDSNFIMNLFMNSGANETFYPNYLCKLFFEALNTQRTNDLYTISFKDGKKEVVCVPFLNGGLFEKAKFDNKTITFPAKLFHNKANDEDPKHRGFLDFLNAFNFTIYEDSPDDHTVAVDPEMLGHIFENLLEDNKDKGAYYTPKEIVHYMCQESLIEYLNTKLNVFEVPLGYTDKGLKTEKPKSKPMQLALTQTDVRDNIKRQEIEDFVKNKNANEFIFKNAKSIDGYLDKVKVCDPAIGSGAFPMGLMQEIFALKMVLHDFVFTTSNELFHLKDYDPQNYRSNVKLNIIQNSIYGVDIEHGAVDIARLRFWLSLIVDEQIPKALPNLDYKIVTGNSLLSKFDDEVIDIDWEVKAGTEATKKLQQQIHSNLEKLFAKQKQFFNFKGDKPKLQAEIRNLKIEVLKNQLELDKYKYSQKVLTSGSMFGQSTKEKQQAEATGIQLASYDKAIKKLEKLKQQPDKPLNFFDWKLNFPEVMNKELNPDNGFDIVIGNPPYIEFKKVDANTKNTYKKFETAKGKYDVFVLFIEISERLLKNGGVHSFINPTTFMMKDYGSALRKFIQTKFKINEIIDFSDYQIFEGVTTFTGIFNFSKSNDFKYDFLYHRLYSNSSGKISIDTLLASKTNSEFKELIPINSSLITDNNWLFSNASDAIIIDKLHSVNLRLKDITKYIFVGIQSGKDEVFFIDKELIEKYHLERRLLHKILKGKDIKKYSSVWGGTYIIYPYDLKSNSSISELELKSKYPNIYSYLKSNKKNLAGRDYFEKSNKFWYELWCERNYLKFQEIKIINCEISSNNRFHLDEDGFLGNTKTFNTVLKKEYSAYYYLILGILNSNLLNFYHKRIASPKAGGFYDYKTQFIEKYPIILSKEKKIEENVKKILLLKKNNPNSDTSNIEIEIDNLVYKLYNLSYDEVKLIEPDFGLSESEYEKIKL